MRKIALALGALLTLAAGGAAPVAAGSENTQIALFQERNIFHSGLREAHTIALTFDDGPNAHTDEVLDALKEMHVQATFFIVGKQARAHHDVLARIAREGHLLANHSGSHAFLGARYDADPRALVEQVRDVHEQIAPLMPADAKFYFRAPYGKWTNAHARILNADTDLRRYVGPLQSFESSGMEFMSYLREIAALQQYRNYASDGEIIPESALCNHVRSRATSSEGSAVCPTIG